nr:zinc carboxypeptidase family protein [Kibdelosporangium sp. MJ126-NF4]CTQ94051.1 zinc carboxypeptidase family protein [Kibdelosporangium sp. MJ126-NF4]
MIPDEPGFPGPDEVAARLAQHGTPQRIGTSRLGEPITMVTIGDGPKSALVFAGPHPNEPIGFLTVPHLAEHVAKDDMGYTWHLIGCVDPDGARLNENWYDGPLDRERYLRGFYRPPLDEQVEWTFPDGMPETRALRDVIDEVRPDLLCSLHNAELGGTFYYITEDRPELAEQLAALPTGIPLHVGEAEMPGTTMIRPGVFLFPTLEAASQLASGMSSVHYAQRYGTFSLVIEVPMWSDPRSSDDSPSGRSRRDMFADVAGMFADVGRMPNLPLDALTVRDSPFLRAYHDFRISAERFAGMLRSHEQDGEATVAEWFGLQETAHMLRLRTCAIGLRILDGELGVGNHRAAVRSARRAFDELFTRWLAEENSVAEPIPPSRLAQAQLEAILSAAKS